MQVTTSLGTRMGSEYRTLTPTKSRTKARRTEGLSSNHRRERGGCSLGTFPTGAAGVGDLPSTQPHAAVANAICNGTRVRIRQLPALPEKLLAGLKALKMGAT